MAPPHSFRPWDCLRQRRSFQRFGPGCLPRPVLGAEEAGDPDQPRRLRCSSSWSEGCAESAAARNSQAGPSGRTKECSRQASARRMRHKRKCARSGRVPFLKCLAADLHRCRGTRVAVCWSSPVGRENRSLLHQFLIYTTRLRRVDAVICNRLSEHQHGGSATTRTGCYVPEAALAAGFLALP